MLRILLDENIDGYAEYLSRHVFSPTWDDVSSSLYLLTDNRNDEKPGSLESVIRERNVPTTLPVFTISDISRLRSEREYVEALVAKLLEYLMDADKLRGVGRLYLP